MNISILRRDDISAATRDELIELLEGDFCVQCYDYETTYELRDAAYQNWDTEFGEKK